MRRARTACLLLLALAAAASAWAAPQPVLFRPSAPSASLSGPLAVPVVSLAAAAPFSAVRPVSAPGAATVAPLSSAAAVLKSGGASSLGVSQPRVASLRARDDAALLFEGPRARFSAEPVSFEPVRAWVEPRREWRTRQAKRRHDMGGTLKDANFRRWFHRHEKRRGDADADEDELDATYAEWVRAGRPNN